MLLALQRSEKFTDSVTISLCALCFLESAVKLVKIEGLKGYLKNGANYPDMVLNLYSFLYFGRVQPQIIALKGFLLVYRFIKLTPGTDKVTYAILSFIAVFAVVVCSFALLGKLLFGHQESTYSS